MSCLKYIFLIIFFPGFIFCQEIKIELKLIIKDEENNLINNAKIIIQGKENKTITFYTDEKGKADIQIIKGKYTLFISHSRYASYSSEIQLNGNLTQEIKLKTKENELETIIVTAKESKGITTKSIIDKKALELLQPSSFTDVLELLPGGLAKDPVFTSVNPIQLRQASSVSGYNTNSLGTLFMIDGIPINTNADLQYSPDPLNQTITNGQRFSNQRKKTTSIGIDMRTISTDDIEKVEIIRGIPSVEYGDLTSGVVNITRKKGGNKWEGRFKADGYSKLYYIAKGFEIPKYQWNINASMDVLDAKSEPRNTYDTYKRYTASLRSQKIFSLTSSQLVWDLNLDFTGSIDDEKFDPDTGYDKIDRYKSTYYKYGISNNFELLLKKKWIKDIQLSTSIREEVDKIEQIKFIQLPAVAPLPISMDEGAFDGIYLDKNYASNLYVEGKPLDVFLKLISNMYAKTLGFKHSILIGSDWTYSKNNGRGQIYNRLQPPNLNMGSFPRRYKDIPSMSKLSLYAEDKIGFNINKNHFILSLGLRSFKMTNMDHSYKLAKSFFWEPRANFQWSMPQMFIHNKAFTVDITLGYGEHKKVPTLELLYPDLHYINYTQLNYFHNNPEYRKLNFQTYIINKENKDLTVANNNKKEIRFDFSYDNNNLSVTIFREKMTSGFRSMTYYKHFIYKKYITDNIDHINITAPPDLTNLSYEIKNDFATYTKTENGSTTDKKGVEFQYSSKRFSIINTRFTFSGAWFNTIYRNSVPMYKSSDVILNNEKIPFVGLYKDDDGYELETFSTSFMADTYIPILKMNFLASVQCSWYNLTEYMKKDRSPLYYMGYDEVLHPYTEADKNDTYLKWLYRDNNNLDSRRVPLSLNINLKFSKKMYHEKITVSMFVNKLYNYNKKYEIYGVVQRRSSYSPYFGMEINFKL